MTNTDPVLCSVAPTGAPFNPIITARAADSVTMEWTPYKEQNIDITEYRVQYRISEIGAMESKVVKVSDLADSSEPKYIASSLDTGTDYEFQVAANSVHGCGPFSDLISVKTL